MGKRIPFSLLHLLLLMLFLWLGAFDGANVTYDHRSLIIDGQRKLLISASIHYPRSVPQMWPGLIQTAKEGGADVIDSYVFWNGHEPTQGNYYFEGRYDLVKFVKTVQQAGMYMFLRIGPFVAAEWFYGGIPIWLHYIPGTVFRTDNEPFKHHMQKFTTFIVDLMKKKKLFASQGGPIILAQVENEYGFYESAYGSGGKNYALWAANMAVSQNIGVPWIMCEQPDAPDPVINTCNSFYCDQFTPNSPAKPKFWTENWPGWFKSFGSRDPHRPVEDVAFAVARFFQKGGSLNNYYMYHGGTNFNRTNGPFLTTSYDYDAPIDEYGLPRLPKWSHLKELHQVIKLCEKPLLYGEAVNIFLGPSLEADEFTDSSGSCAAFLANTDYKEDKMVEFRNRTYSLPAWSVSILPDCDNEAFNTAKVTSQSSIMEMVPEEVLKPLEWEVFVEKHGVWGEAEFVKNDLVDLINTTKYTTDYLWYTTSVYIDEEMMHNSEPTLLVESKGHALLTFVNGQIQGYAKENRLIPIVSFSQQISLKVGENEIAILCMTVGLQTAGPFYEWKGAGLTSVKIVGLRGGTMDLSSSKWSYKIGLEGESLGLYKGEGLNSSKWLSTLKPPTNQPLTWYKTVVDPPSGDEPVGLDMLHMGKGLAWLNGESIGIYYPVRNLDLKECVEECDYRGKFSPDKCSTGCGEPTQRWYHVPRSWFKPSGNILVIFEERGGDPTKINFSKRKATNMCSLVADGYPTGAYLNSEDKRVRARLKCPPRTKIHGVKFASFGNPTGSCGSYSLGSCHDPASTATVERECIDKNECRVELTGENFRKDLCSGTRKRLAIEVVCL